MGRDDWESAGGIHDRLAKRMTLRRASVTSKPVSVVASDAFSSKHGGMMRLLEALMNLPGSKWKMQENKNSVRLSRFTDVSKFLVHVRMTANDSFQCVRQRH